MNRIERIWYTRLGDLLPFAAAAGVVALAGYFGRRPSSSVLMLFLALTPGLLLIQEPRLGLAALAALSFTLPLTIGTGGAVSLTAPVLIIPTVAAIWLVDGMRRRSLEIPPSRLWLPLGLFLVSGLLSWVAGLVYWDPLVPQPENLLLVQIGQWALYALSAAALFLGGTLGARGRWLRLAVAAFVIVGAGVLLQFFLPPLSRLLGWATPNMAHRSMFWVWLAGLAGGQLLFNKHLQRSTKLGLLLILLAGAYVLWIRFNDWSSGWLPFTATLITVVWFHAWQKSRPAAILLAVALLILLVAVFPALYQHAGGDRELEMSWGGRQLLYEAVLDLVKDHPILGLGPAAYRHYGHYRWVWLGVGNALYTQPNISSHNNLIDIYAQQGLLGLGLFLWFLVEVVRLGWRLKDRFVGSFESGYVIGVLGGLVGTMVAMLLADWFLPFVYNIGFTGFRTSALAWMFLGGLVALARRAEDSDPTICPPA